MLLSVAEVERSKCFLPGAPIEALQSMTTEAYKRGTGPLSAERGTGRLRPAPSPDSALDKTSPPTPASQMRHMSPSEFNTAMIHFYRGEIQRSNTWRNRLDTTTNWAVLTAGATLSLEATYTNGSVICRLGVIDPSAWTIAHVRSRA